MASTIRTVIETLFTTRGADEAAGAADRVGRAQTRLGNSSAGAGRQFSTQSAGLGGLVGAYAGAAATTFALTAAFDALSKSAMSTQTIAGVSTLASNMGQDGSKILGTIRDITNAQLSLAATAEQVNLALSAGFNTKQVEGLATVATKASKALGRDLTDSMTRLVRGSAKMEAELIDELGIYTKIGPATAAYAATIGKATSSLTEFERRQAFVNAVIAEGEKKFSSISTTVPTAAGKLQAFNSKIIDLAQQFGSLLADYIAPLAEFLTNNASAAFAAFGLILSLVASKGMQVLQTALTSMTDSINNAGIRAEALIRNLLGIGKATKVATAAVKTLDLATTHLTDTQKAQLLALQTTAGTRNLGNAELKQTTTLLNQSITGLQNERTTRQSNINTLNQQITAQGAAKNAAKDTFTAARDNVAALRAQGAAIQVITDAEKARATAQGKYGAATRALNTVTTANTALITSNTTAVAGYTAAITNQQQMIAKLDVAKGFKGSLASFATGVAKVSTGMVGQFTGAVTGMVSGAARLMFLGSMFVMIGNSIAAASGKGAEFNAFLKGAAAAAKGFLGGTSKADGANVFKGVGAKALQDLEAVDSKLKDLNKFTFTSKVYGITVKLDKTKEELANEVSELMAEAVAGPKTIGQSLTSGKALGGAAAGAITGAVIGGIAGIAGGPAGILAGAAIGRNIGLGIGYTVGTIWDYLTPDDAAVPADVAASIKRQYASLFEDIAPEAQDKLVGVIAKIKDKYGAAARVDPGAAAAMKLQIDLVRESAKYMDNVQVISELMIATGQTADQIVKIFNFDTAVEQIEYINKAFMDIGSTKLTFSFIDSESPEIKKILDLPLEAKTYTDQVQNKLSAMLTSQSASSNNPLDFSGDPDRLLGIVDSVNEIQRVMDSTGVGVSSAIDTVLTQQTGFSDALYNIQRSGVDLVAVFNLVKGSIIDESEALATAIGSFNAFSEQSARLGNVQGVLNNSIADGSITLESYSQSLGNARSSLIDTVRAQTASKATMDALQVVYQSLRDAGETDRASTVLDVLSNMRLEYDEVSRTLKAQRDINKELAEQEGRVRGQVEIYDFLNSFKKAEKNKLNIELDFVTAGSNPLEALQKQLDYLQNFKSVQLDSVTISNEQVASYDKQSKALAGIDLQAGEIGRILETTNVEDAKKQIDGLGLGLQAVITQLPSGIRALKVTATSGAEATFTPLIDGAGKAIGIFKAADEAQQTLIKQAVEALPAFMDAGFKEFKTMADSFNKEISSISNKEIVARVKFEADITGLQNNLQQQVNQRRLSVKESDFAIAQATTGGDVAGAAQSLAAMQKKVIDDQVAAAKEDYANKVAIINAENAASKIALNLEADMQTRKLKNDRDYVAKITNLAIDQGNIMVNAGNSVGAGIVSAFNEGAKVIKAALGTLGGGTVTTGTYTAPGLPDMEALKKTMLDTQASYDAESKAAEGQVIALRDAKVLELDRADIRQKSIAAQGAMNSLYSIYSNKFTADNNTLSEIVIKETERTQELQKQLTLAKMQNAINIQSAKNTLSATITANSIAASERQLELGNQGLSNLQAANGIELQSLKNNNELLDIKAQIANTKGSGNSAQDKAQLEAIKNQTKLNAAQYELVRMERDVSSTQREIEDKKRANIELEKKILEDNYKNQVAAIKASGNGQAAQTKAQLESLDRQLKEIDKERRFKQEENIKAQAQFDAETQLMVRRISADITKYKNDWQILNLTHTMDLQRVKDQKSAADAEYNNTLAQIDGIDMFWNATSSFIDGISTFAGIVREFVAAQNPTDSAASRRLTDLQSTLPDMTAPDSSAARAALEASKAASDASFASQETNINEVFKLQSANNTASIKGLNDQLAYTNQLRELQRQGLITQQDAEMAAYTHQKDMINAQKELATKQLAAAGGGTAAQLAQAKATYDQAMQGLLQQEEDLAYAAGKIGPILKSIKDGIGTSFSDALSSLNSSLLEGTDGIKSFGEKLRNAFFEMFKSIQEQVFKKMIADPIGNFVADFVGKKILGPLGISIAEGAATTQAASAAAAVTTRGSSAILATATTTSTGTVAAANTAGASTLMASLGPILAILIVIAAIVAIFGGGKKKKSSSLAAADTKTVVPSNSSSSGIPTMASGGLRRDRMPTLLEPGEFVIRRPAVNRIGVNNLAAMNATGKANNNAAPVINIKNEGTQKDAQASSPRFDGEKYVIDIIMRDLANNGPVRRTLRGGAI